MISRAQTYAEINRAVEGLIDHHVENDPAVVGYMIARATLLQINALRGAEKAAELYYKLADEFATGGQK